MIVLKIFRTALVGIVMLAAVVGHAQVSNVYYQLPILHGMHVNGYKSQTLTLKKDSLIRYREYTESGILESGYTLQNGKQIQGLVGHSDCCNMEVGDTSYTDDKIVVFQRRYDMKRHRIQDFTTRVLQNHNRNEMSRDVELFEYDGSNRVITITGKNEAPTVRLPFTTRSEIAYSKSGQILGIYYEFTNPNISKGLNVFTFMFVGDSVKNKKTFTQINLNKIFEGQEFRELLSKWDLVNGDSFKTAFLKEYQFNDPESVLPLKYYIYEYDKSGRLKQLNISPLSSIMPGAGQYLPLPNIPEGGYKVKISYYADGKQIKSRKVYRKAPNKGITTYKYSLDGLLLEQSGAIITYSK